MHANLTPLKTTATSICTHKMMTEMAFVLRLPGLPGSDATIVCSIHRLYALYVAEVERICVPQVLGLCENASEQLADQWNLRPEMSFNDFDIFRYASIQGS